MAATYTKLKSGDWGARVEGSVTPGQTITVMKRSGESKAETVEKVVWTGNGVSLCSLKPAGRSASSSSGSRSGSGYGAGHRSGNSCAECGRGGKLVADLEDGLMKHYNCCDIPPGGY